MAVVAVYLGESDEEKINSMSIPFFNDVLKFLGKRVNYDAVVNYAGNSFAKDSWKLIQEANPLVKENRHGRGFMELIEKGTHKATKKDLEGMDWINEVVSESVSVKGVASSEMKNDTEKEGGA